MRKVRIAAALLAVLTALIDALLCLNPTVAASVLVLVGVAAVCLAAVVPINALDPPARKLVVAACLGFVVTMGVAVWRGLGLDTDRTVIAVMLGLFVAGALLSLWAFSVRNRRRRPGWANYYES